MLTVRTCRRFSFFHRCRFAACVFILLALAFFSYTTFLYPVEFVKERTNKDIIRKLDVQPPVKSYNSEMTFCESSFLGCFKESANNESALIVRFQFMTVTWCLSFCQSNGNTYAALKSGDTCMCSRNFDDVANKRETSGACDLTCPGAGRREGQGEDEGRSTCGGERSVSGHFVKGNCVQTPYTDQYVQSRKRGCIQYSKADLPKSHVVTGTSNECLAICQQERHLMAIYSPRKQCWCGRMDIRIRSRSMEECSSGESLEIFRTLQEDKRCGNVRLLPAGQHNRTLLTSYPGSGNTWIRYLLEKATGYYTGSYYKDAEINAMGYLGETLKPIERRTDLLKDHLFGKRAVPEDLHSIVMVIRNPYKSILSFLNYVKSDKDHHLAYASEDVIKQAINNKTIQGKMGSWLRYHFKVLESTKPKLILFYEEVVADPISSVRRIVNFLPNPLLHPKNLEERLTCLGQELTGLAKRNSHQYSFEIYPPDVRVVVNKAIDDLRTALLKTGVSNKLPLYEKGPDMAW